MAEKLKKTALDALEKIIEDWPATKHEAGGGLYIRRDVLVGAVAQGRRAERQLQEALRRITDLEGTMAASGQDVVTEEETAK